MRTKVLHTTEEYREIFYKYILPLKEEFYGLVVKNIKEKQDTEDVYQQIFANCWKSLPMLKDLSASRQWAYRIARRSISDYYKIRFQDMEIPCPEYVDQKQSDQWKILISGKDEMDFVRKLLEEERMDCLWEAFEKLEEKYRGIIWLWYDREWSLKQVAAELDMNYNTVRVMFSRGTSKLKNIYLEMQESEHADE